MSEQNQEKRKRKQPPTFQHFPAEQAKKLKKAWIEKARVKSKWASEKRKLQASGELPVITKPWDTTRGKGKRKPEQREEEEEEEEEGIDSADSDSPSDTGDQREGSDTEELRFDAEIDGRPSKRTKVAKESKSSLPTPPHLRQRRDEGPSKPIHNRTSHSDDPHRKPKSSWQEEIQNSQQDRKPSPRDLKGKGREHAAPPDAAPSEAEQKPSSLRDLKLQAYDKKNLHNFRADPLRKHTGRGGHFNARGGRGGASGRGSRGGQPRGQPNMKLRMNYMLEKIKSDYAS